MSANAPDTVQLPRLGYGDLEGDGSVGGAAAGDGGTGLSPPPPSSSSSPSSSWLSWPTLAARILLLLLLASLEGGVMEVSSTAVEKEPGRGRKEERGCKHSSGHLCLNHSPSENLALRKPIILI